MIAAMIYGVISDILVEKNLKYRGIRALLSDCEKRSLCLLSKIL